MSADREDFTAILNRIKQENGIVDDSPAASTPLRDAILSKAKSYGLSQSSGFRTKRQNASAGGAINSHHMEGTPQEPGAYDFTGDAKNMRAFYKDLADNDGPNLVELYHGNSGMKRGKVVPGIPKHNNHVHVAIRPEDDSASASPFTIALRRVTSGLTEPSINSSDDDRRSNALTTRGNARTGGGELQTDQQTQNRPERLPAAPEAEDFASILARITKENDLSEEDNPIVSPYVRKTGVRLDDGSDGYTRKPLTGRRIKESVAISAGAPFGEDDTYRQWYTARQKGDINAMRLIGKAYLKQFPKGKYAEYVANGAGQMRSISTATAKSTGAGGYVPVSEIEAMRKRGMRDEDILRTIQDRLAGDIGLSASDVAVLTDKYGNHPLANIVEPGSNVRSSVDSIIRQGKSNQGLAEFNITPETIQMLQADMSGNLVNPSYAQARATTWDRPLYSDIVSPETLAGIGRAAEMGVRTLMPGLNLLDLKDGRIDPVINAENAREAVQQGVAFATNAERALLQGLTAPLAGIAALRQGLLRSSGDAGTVTDQLRQLGNLGGRLQSAYRREEAERTADTFAGKQGQGFGSSASMMLLGSLPGVGGLGATEDVIAASGSRLGQAFAKFATGITSPAAFTGALQQAGQTYDEALQKGASRQQAANASIFGAMIGLTEGFGLGGTIDRAFLKKVSSHLVKEFFKEGLEEAGQEGLQNFLGDILASATYDPSRSAFSRESLMKTLDAAANAFVTGGVMGGMTHVGGNVYQNTADALFIRKVERALERGRQVSANDFADYQDAIVRQTAREQKIDLHNEQEPPTRSRENIGNESAKQAEGVNDDDEKQPDIIPESDRSIQPSGQVTEEPFDFPRPFKDAKPISTTPLTEQLTPGQAAGAVNQFVAQVALQEQQEKIAALSSIANEDNAVGTVPLSRSSVIEQSPAAPDTSPPIQANNHVMPSPIRADNTSTETIDHANPAAALPHTFQQGDVVSHPDVAGGKPMAVTDVSRDGKSLALRHTDGSGPVMQMQIDSPVYRGLQRIDHSPSGEIQTISANSDEVAQVAAPSAGNELSVAEQAQRDEKNSPPATSVSVGRIDSGALPGTGSKYRTDSRQGARLQIPTSGGILELNENTLREFENKTSILPRQVAEDILRQQGIEDQALVDYVAAKAVDAYKREKSFRKQLNKPTRIEYFRKFAKLWIDGESGRLKKLGRESAPVNKAEAPFDAEHKYLAERIRNSFIQSENESQANLPPKKPTIQETQESPQATFAWDGRYMAVNRAGLLVLTQMYGKKLEGVALTRKKALVYANRALEFAKFETGLKRENLLDFARAIKLAASESEEFGIGLPTSIQHELFHVAQIWLRRIFGIDIDSEAATRLPGYKKASQRLLLKGYKTLDPRILAHETAAHINNEQYDELGLSFNEAFQFMKEYFRLIDSTYGENSVKAFDVLDQRYEEIKNEIIGQTGQSERTETTNFSGADVSHMERGRRQSSAQGNAQKEKTEEDSYENVKDISLENLKRIRNEQKTEATETRTGAGRSGPQNLQRGRQASSGEVSKGTGEESEEPFENLKRNSISQGQDGAAVITDSAGLAALKRDSGVNLGGGIVNSVRSNSGKLSQYHIEQLAKALAANLDANYHAVLSVVNAATDGLDRRWLRQILKELRQRNEPGRTKLSKEFYAFLRRRREKIRRDGRGVANLERRSRSGESSADSSVRQRGVSPLSTMASRPHAQGNRAGARNRDRINIKSDKDTSSDKLSQNTKGTKEFLQDRRAITRANQSADISAVAQDAKPIAVTNAKTAAAAWAQITPNTSAEQMRVMEQMFDALAKGFVRMNPGKTEADYYQRIAFQKGGNVGADALYHKKPPVMFSSRDIKGAIDAKRQLKATGFPKAKITEFINQYYNRESYKNLLQGQDNVYLVMPSTSNKNKVPLHLAERLQRDFGGVVENDFADPLAKKEAKTKHKFSERIADPIDFDVFEDLSEYRGKNIVIVDDIFTTGESTSALRIALGQEGIEAAHTAVLVSAANYPIKDYDIMQLAGGLADHLGADYNSVLSVVNDAIEGLNGNWFERVLDEFRGTSGAERKKIAEQFYGFFRRRAEKIRGDGRGVTNLERRVGSGQESPDSSVRQGGVPTLSEMATRPDARGNRDGVGSREEPNLESTKDPSTEKLSQDAKGAVEFLQDGRAIIHAFETADISTLLHELAHVARRYLDAKSLAIIENWAGVENGLWNRTAEEKFARGFERYLYQGNAPTKELKSAFAKIRGWMREIYQRIKGSDIDVKLSRDVERVFARILGADVENAGNDAPVQKAGKSDGGTRAQTGKWQYKQPRQLPAGKGSGFFSYAGYGSGNQQNRSEQQRGRLKATVAFDGRGREVDAPKERDRLRAGKATVQNQATRPSAFLTRERLTATGKRHLLTDKPAKGDSLVNSVVTRGTTIYGAAQRPSRAEYVSLKNKLLGIGEVAEKGNGIHGGNSETEGTGKYNPLNPKRGRKNCVQCVSALIINKLKKRMVVNGETIIEKVNLGTANAGRIDLALRYIYEATGLEGKKAAFADSNAPAGHYVIFLKHPEKGTFHVIYGQVLANGKRYMYDPQSMMRANNWQEMLSKFGATRGEAYWLH